LRSELPADSTDKKSRRGRTRCRVQPRRLTLQRAARNRRAALHL